jgi:hypothetical protein
MRVEKGIHHLVAKREGKNQLGDLSLDKRAISKWFLEKYGVTMWTGFICIRIGRAVVKTVMILLGSYTADDFLFDRLLVSH